MPPSPFCHESPILGILSAATIITEFALESRANRVMIGWKTVVAGIPKIRT